MIASEREKQRAEQLAPVVIAAMAAQDYEERELGRQREVSGKLTEVQWLAMQNVVTYLADELDDWIAAGQPDAHIWPSVRELQDLLKKAGKIPNIANFYAAPDGSGFLSDGHGDD
jgi:hypothetical protein